MEDNTNPEFFMNWPKHDMIDELVRLNKLLKELSAELNDITNDLSTLKRALYQHNSLNEL